MTDVLLERVWAGEGEVVAGRMQGSSKGETQASDGGNEGEGCAEEVVRDVEAVVAEMPEVAKDKSFWL